MLSERKRHSEDFSGKIAASFDRFGADVSISMSYASRSSIAFDEINENLHI